MFKKKSKSRTALCCTPKTKAIQRSPHTTKYLSVVRQVNAELVKFPLSSLTSQEGWPLRTTPQAALPRFVDDEIRHYTSSFCHFPLSKSQEPGGLSPVNLSGRVTPQAALLRVVHGELVKINRRISHPKVPRAKNAPAGQITVVYGRATTNVSLLLLLHVSLLSSKGIPVSVPWGPD